jgi:hypothetical protein
VTANAARVVDDFRPLHAIGARCFMLDHGCVAANISETGGRVSTIRVGESVGTTTAARRVNSTFSPIH